jgi:hypothetical protein
MSLNPGGKMDQNETKQQYVNYVISVLAAVKAEGVSVKASYDTGYGLRLVTENIGNETHILNLLAITVEKIRPPFIEGDFDQWNEAWIEGKSIVRKFIKSGKLPKEA